MTPTKELLFILLFPLAYSEIINLDVFKYIDITSQLVKIDITVLFKNDGPTQIQNYHYVLDPDVTDAYIEFYSMERLAYRKQNESSYMVNLEKPIFPNANAYIKIEIIYMNKIKTLTNTERKERTIRYSGNLYFYSPYHNVKYSAIYHVDKMEILQLSLAPTSRNQTDFVYEFQNIPAYSFRNIIVHCINDVPFFVVIKLERTIDISHLGSVFIEDSVELINEGPRLTKIYEPPLTRRLPQLLFTHLPASASNIKLFDEIGNNSKSSIIHEDNYITLRFEARYPLRQSWKTQYILQYNLPVYEYLRKARDLYSFKMRVVDHVLPDVIVKDLRTKVLLPQDSEIVSVANPMGATRDTDERLATALSFNRPTVVFTARNLPENCVPEFVITYSSPFLGLFKPALFISAYIEVVLISCIAFRRIDMYLRSN